MLTKIVKNILLKKNRKRWVVLLEIKRKRMQNIGKYS